MQFSNTVLLSVLSSLSLVASVPIDKRSVTAPLKIDFSVKRVDQKFDSNVATKHAWYSKTVQSSVEVDLENQYALYVANLEIGTPAQSLQVDVDTGSSDLWVPAVGTTSKYGSFDASSSSSYHKLSDGFLIGYGDGSKATGDWATEDVTVGGATVKDIQFGYATNQTTGTGLLGVGFSLNEAPVAYNGSDYEYPNFPAQLKAQGIIDKNAYSLYLNSIDADSGSILFGAVDTAKYEDDLQTLDIVNIDDGGNPTEKPTAFFVNLNEISSSSKTFTNGTVYPALLDSGTTLIYAPTEIATSFGEKYGHKIPFVNMYFTSCSTEGEPIQFTFEGKTIEVPFKDLLFHPNGKQSKPFLNQCILGVVPSQANYYILGDAFLRSAYVKYDLEDNQIGLAQVKYTTESKIELIQ